jgi:serine phosphatase RsbU (regulator of sigma subunit)
MARLVILQGPNLGTQFPLGSGTSIIGRQPDSTVCLESLSVSRQHARIVERDGWHFVEDMGSSNGTFLNGNRILGSLPLTERDTLQIGPYLLGLRPDPVQRPLATNPVISAQISVQSTNYTLFAQNPAYKLQVMLEIAGDLSRTLDLDAMLGKLLDHLVRLFPQTDRCMVLLYEGERLGVRAQRGHLEPDEYPYSRTIVQRALEEGVGILSEDLSQDQQLVKSETLLSLNLHSFLCVPLICQDRRLGVIQLDCIRPGAAFRTEDLELLTAIALQVAVVLVNVALHAEHLREERFRQELAMAREIQQGFLPSDFSPLGDRDDFELFARIYPARDVSGDLYDFFPLEDGRLAFFVGDVSGKGIPAALFMIAVRTLSRHLASAATGPAETLSQLNTSLSVDNPSVMFVTLVYGNYDPRTGDVVLSSAGHPLPLLRRANGVVDVVELRTGRLLGYPGEDLGLTDIPLRLEPGETLILYTDGFTEAHAPDRTLFDVDRLREVLSGPRAAMTLAECAQEARKAVEQFTGTSEPQDDMTLLLLRRRSLTADNPG